jgi:hypothetical protein
MNNDREERYLKAQWYVVILWAVVLLAILLTACTPQQEVKAQRSESYRVYDRDGNFEGRIQGKRIYDRDGNYIGMIHD